MSLEDGRNIATIVGAAIALVVYITNSVEQRRQRQIENATRFMEAHRDLMKTEFVRRNIRAMELGTFKRENWNEDMELCFNEFLSEIEHVALLERCGAVSDRLAIYMFGWTAQRVQPILTPEERNNVYWEVAVRYLDKLKNSADDFYKLTKSQREKYHLTKHFRH